MLQFKIITHNLKTLFTRAFPRRFIIVFHVNTEKPWQELRIPRRPPFTITQIIVHANTVIT